MVKADTGHSFIQVPQLVQSSSSAVGIIPDGMGGPSRRSLLSADGGSLKSGTGLNSPMISIDSSRLFLINSSCLHFEQIYVQKQIKLPVDTFRKI